MHDGEVRSLECVARYNLGKIALKLRDIEYPNWKKSYPYFQFKKAKRLYGDYPMLHNDYVSMKDSIDQYLDIVKNDVKNRVKTGVWEKAQGDVKNLQAEAVVFFSYKYDQDFRVHIDGRVGRRDGYTIRAMDESGEKQEYADHSAQLEFNRKVRLSKGGKYKIGFSKEKESIKNLLVSIGSLGAVVLLY